MSRLERMKGSAYTSLHADSPRERKILDTLKIASVVAEGIWFKTRREFSLDDLFMEGSLAVIKSIDLYTGDSESSFKAFITSCVRNQIWDYIRKLSKYQVKDFNGLQQFEADEDGVTFGQEMVLSDRPNPEEEVIAKSMIALCLDPKRSVESHRHALVSHFMEGKSCREIGIETGSSTGTVSCQVHRAKVSIINSLKGDWTMRGKIAA